MKLSIVEENDNIVVISLSGRMDMDGIALVDAALTEHAIKKDAIVDMCLIEYMASFGIRKLIQLAKESRKNQKKIVLARPQKMVEGVLSLANIDTIIAVLPSVEAGKEFLKK